MAALAAFDCIARRFVQTASLISHGCGEKRVSAPASKLQHVPSAPSVCHVTHVQHGNAAANQRIKDCVDRALTGGIGAGTSIAIGLELLKALSEPRFAPSSLAELCCLPPEPDSIFHLHWFSIFLGICVGLILEPVLCIMSCLAPCLLSF